MTTKETKQPKRSAATAQNQNVYICRLCPDQHRAKAGSLPEIENHLRRAHGVIGGEVYYHIDITPLADVVTTTQG